MADRSPAPLRGAMTTSIGWHLRERLCAAAAQVGRGYGTLVSDLRLVDVVLDGKQEGAVFG